MPKNIDASYPELVQKAQTLFWINGFKAVKPEDLANHLNVSLSTIYNKYGKDHLFIDALHTYIDSITDPAMKTLRDSTKGKETFRDLFYPLIDALVDGTFPRSCLMVNTVMELRNEIEAVNDIYNHYFNILRESYASVLERLYKQGEIKHWDKIPEYTEFLLGITFGLSVLHKIKTREELRVHIDEQISLLL